MALTLVTNPVGSGSVKLFAGFKPIEFIFKREDLVITGSESGSGGVKINVTTDLTSYLSPGDSLYLYSEGADYTYDTVGEILSLTATDITINIPFIQTSTGGYINYLKNYYVEMQCVDKDFNDSNILGFSLESDGDAAGNISIDVAIVNDLNIQRGAITQEFIDQSATEFLVKYRQVYDGSSESFTVVEDKLIVTLYAKENPEENTILNSFEVPKLYLGYEAALVSANIAGPAASTTELTYRELDVNKELIADGTLGSLDKDVNGYLCWKWPSNVILNQNTKYIEFNFAVEVTFDFKAVDFAYPDFLTQ